MSQKTEKIVDTKEKGPVKGAIVAQAHSRFRQAANVERRNRLAALDDLNMLAGINHWPANVTREREEEGRPVLTINKLPSFVDQVINDSRINKIAIKIKPYGKGATAEIANTLNGMIRNIENVSDADVAYQGALEGAVNNGFGYFRIVTAYSDDTAFEQEILIRRIRNPMTVYFDPAHVMHDGSDARYVFISEMVSREEYAVRFPGKTLVPFNEADEPDSTHPWMEEKQVRIAEYWVKEPVVKKLYLLSDGRTVDGDDWDSVVEEIKSQEKIVHFIPNQQDPNGPPEPVEGPAPEGTDFPEEVVNPTPTVVRERIVDSHKVVQYLIDGSQIIEGPIDWAGKYIPVVPVWGKELVINEERFLRGLIRFAKDPQRMYNFFRTAATETVALAPKAPYVMDERQVEGHEGEWSLANRKNYPYLLYKGIKGVPAPQRQVVTQTAMGEITEANISNDEMKATTSLHNPSLGSSGNEVSGKAIMARQQRGEIANFVFHDNLKRAVRYAGEIMVDLIPAIYDTYRQVAIIKDTGDDDMILINQPVVHTASGEEVIINDLSMGRYKVIAVAGPSFATQREEAANSMLDFVRTSPEQANMVMDLVVEAMDWPGAAKIAARLKKLLPPGIDDEGPLPPPEPDLDEIIKDLKAKGIGLGNMLKELDTVKKKRELEDHDRDMIEAGATGAINTITGGQNGTDQGGGYSGPPQQS